MLGKALIWLLSNQFSFTLLGSGDLCLLCRLNDFKFLVNRVLFNFLQQEVILLLI